MHFTSLEHLSSSREHNKARQLRKKTCEKGMRWNSRPRCLHLNYCVSHFSPDIIPDKLFLLIVSHCFFSFHNRIWFLEHHKARLWKPFSSSSFFHWISVLLNVYNLSFLPRLSWKENIHWEKKGGRKKRRQAYLILLSIKIVLKNRKNKS